MRVVIAHRNRPYAEQLQDELESIGHVVEVATNGVECWECVRTTQPDVIAIGSHLLWGGSEGVLSMMQDDHQFHDIPVLLIADTLGSNRLPQHPMVTSSIDHFHPLEQIANQLTILDLIYNGSYSTASSTVSR